MKIIHHASKESVEGLFRMFLKPTQDAKGHLIWIVPKWLQVMLDTAQK